MKATVLVLLIAACTPPEQGFLRNVGNGSGLSVDDQRVYWTDATGVWSMPKTGGDASLIAPWSGDRVVHMEVGASTVFVATEEVVVSIPKAGGAATELPDSRVPLSQQA